MASCMPETERERELLSQAILRTLQSWPEFHRRIFSEVHYRGRSVETVAQTYAMSTGEVSALLEDCERKLWKALRLFRPIEPQYVDRCA